MILAERAEHVGLSKYYGKDVKLKFNMGNKICCEKNGLFKFLLLNVRDENDEILTDNLWVYGDGDTLFYATQLCLGIKDCEITGRVAKYSIGVSGRGHGGYSIINWSEINVDTHDASVRMWRDAGLYRASYTVDGVETEIRL